jgi:hypothetical protein
MVILHSPIPIVTPIDSIGSTIKVFLILYLHPDSMVADLYSAYHHHPDLQLCLAMSLYYHLPAKKKKK